MFNVNGKIYRTLPEQVEKNKDDIQDWLNVVTTLANFGIKVVGQEPTALNLPDPNTYISQGGAYGDCYLVGIEIPYDYYIFTRHFEGETEPKWLNIGQFPLPGPQGPQGVQGEQGPQGEASLWYVGTSDNPVSTNLSEGDCYLNVTNGNVYYYKNNTWTLKGNIKGPQGVQGEQGEAGATGATGAQGPQGPAGPTGIAVHVIGIVSSTAELPTPTALADLTAAYLVGASSPYNLYIQVGNSVETAIWTNMGALNVCLWELDGTTAMPIEAVTSVNINNLVINNAIAGVNGAKVNINGIYVGGQYEIESSNIKTTTISSKSGDLELYSNNNSSDSKAQMILSESYGVLLGHADSDKILQLNASGPQIYDSTAQTSSPIATEDYVEVNKAGATPTGTATTITVGSDTYELGGGHLYRHSCFFKGFLSAEQFKANVIIITTSDVPFTSSTLANFLYNNNFTSYTSNQMYINYYFTSNVTGLMGMYSPDGTTLLWGSTEGGGQYNLANITLTDTVTLII